MMFSYAQLRNHHQKYKLCNFKNKRTHSRTKKQLNYLGEIQTRSYDKQPYTYEYIDSQADEQG